MKCIQKGQIITNGARYIYYLWIFAPKINSIKSKRTPWRQVRSKASFYDIFFIKVVKNMSSSSQICFVSVTFYIISLLAERAGGGVIFCHAWAATAATIVLCPPLQVFKYNCLRKTSSEIPWIEYQQKSLILQHCERNSNLTKHCFSIFFIRAI